jgi:hypothetical protein
MFAFNGSFEEYEAIISLLFSINYLYSVQVKECIINNGKKTWKHLENLDFKTNTTFSTSTIKDPPPSTAEDPPSVGDSSDMVSGICQVLGEDTILHSIIQSQQTLLETRNKLIYNQNGQITIQEKLLSLKEECNNLQKEENSNLSNLVRELSISAMRLLIILIVLG